MFYGSPPTYVWEDAEGVELSTLQGEGGEQGDPLLYSFGQHGALEATQEELADGETWSRTSTTCRLCRQSQRSTCMGLCNEICATVARHKFGIGVESDLRDVMRWRGSRRQQTREPVFGVGLVRQICRRHSRESWCGHAFGRPRFHPNASG